MTPEQIAELVKEHRELCAAHVAGGHEAMAELHRSTAAAIESLQASLANAEARYEAAESRNEFLCEIIDAAKEAKDEVQK